MTGSPQGAAETLAWVRTIGARVAFLTNNPLRRGGTYAAKLAGLGIDCVPDEVVTSLDALIGYLADAPPGGPVLLVAEALVGEVLVEAGWQLTERPEEAAMVVVSWDRSFDYPKLLGAFRAVRNGARIVATNPDPFCPTADGGLPDCAAMLAALEACTGTRAEAVVGKPSRHMATTILRRIGVQAPDALMVGDRLLTDVGLARTAGMASGLVLSGATTRAEMDGARCPRPHPCQVDRPDPHRRPDGRRTPGGTTVTEFIFMLTHHDQTVPDALDVYQQLRPIEGLRYVGFKDVGATLEQLRALTAAIHADGRTVMLEVVSEAADAELRSIEAARTLGVDWILGRHPRRGSPCHPGRQHGALLPFPGHHRGPPEPVAGHGGEHRGRCGPAHGARRRPRPGPAGVPL